MMFFNNTIFIHTAWGGGYITIQDLVIDLSILILLLIIGIYIQKRKWEKWLK